MDATISAVIPVRNGARHVTEAIMSCLAQTLPLREIIIVDDGSEDETVEVVTGFGAPVVLLRQFWLGAAMAMNGGVRCSKGDLVAFLDHDDIWLAGKLAIQMAELARQPELDAVFGAVEQFISPEVGEPLRSRLRCPAGLQPALCASALLIRRAALDRYGPFQGGRDATGFLPWFARAKSHGLRFGVPEDIVMRRRLHADNSGLRQMQVNRQQYLDVSRDMILRHRAKRLQP
jgi:glycosyltransferase involved in cell wall biosynthesis